MQIPKPMLEPFVEFMRASYGTTLKMHDDPNKTRGEYARGMCGGSLLTVRQYSDFDQQVDDSVSLSITFPDKKKLEEIEKAWSALIQMQLKETEQ